MDKKALLKKVMTIIESGEMPVAALLRLIATVKRMTQEDNIYKLIYRTLSNYHFSKQRLKEVLSILQSKEKINKISPAHNNAMRKIIKEFGGDYHSFK